MASSDHEDAGVIIVGFSSRGPQSSATHFRHVSAFRDALNRRAGKSSKGLGTVVASKGHARAAQPTLIQMLVRDAARKAAGVTPNCRLNRLVKWLWSANPAAEAISARGSSG